jgi:hypothetical protein
VVGVLLENTQTVIRCISRAQLLTGEYATIPVQEGGTGGEYTTMSVQVDMTPTGN